MLTMRLYLLQRLTALIMVPLVFGHLGLMIYAVQGGLSAGEILGRTQGNLFWALYYGTFVVAASVHAAIGLRSIILETATVRRSVLEVFTCGILISFILMGGQAVYALTLSGIGQ